MHRKGFVDFPVDPEGVRGLNIKQNCYFSLFTQEPSVQQRERQTPLPEHLGMQGNIGIRITV